MAKYVKFDDVHGSVTLKQVLNHYGLMDNAKVRDGEIKLRCPFHDNDTQPSLSVNIEKNIFRCFGCHAGGDLIKFVVLKEGIDTGDRFTDRRKASLLMADWFGIRSKRPTKSKNLRQIKTVDQLEPENKKLSEDIDGGVTTAINPPLPYALKNLDVAHPYLAERGLTNETIEYFGLGYHAGRGIMAGRIAIPLHSPDGILIGYIGRWPGDDGWPEGEAKYKVPSRDKGFYKSHVLYNLHRAREHASEGLIVVEGPFTLFELWQRGRKNVVSTLGSSLSQEQERLIVETVGRRGKVLILYDQDEAGLKGAREAAIRLLLQVFVRLVEP